MGTYDTAQICLNGHIINISVNKYPEENENFCRKCGERTLTSCDKCNTNIKGAYYVGGGSVSEKKPPSYCHNCGATYPWTSARLLAAIELAKTFEKLDEKEKVELQNTLPDLMRDTPSAKVSETKFKRLIRKAGTEAYEGMKDILVDIVSESIKKSTFG